VIAAGGFLCIDMETREYRGMNLEIYRRLREKFPEYPHLGLAVQSYMKETDRDLAELVRWGREKGFPVAVRLVKGAYWDQEVVKARQNGWEIPVHTIKAETDAAFERHAKFLLENSDICSLACGSHNIRSVAAVLETARGLGVPDDRYEFQVLYGMAEPVRKAILAAIGRVRLYAPAGDLVSGMGYLVRRLLENTSNESFLRRTFAAGGGAESLLADPRETAEKERGRVEASSPPETPGTLAPFRNEQTADFSQDEVRKAFSSALASVRRELGRTWPLLIAGCDRAHLLGQPGRSR
jgi:RHH-type transcriptional regulator, proline utilization regulon repressor / proline dehydrogenase / delta 1-pyrroline-5-carboxylate dehydrogenase